MPTQAEAPRTGIALPGFEEPGGKIIVAKGKYDATGMSLTVKPAPVFDGQPDQTSRLMHLIKTGESVPSTATTSETSETSETAGKFRTALHERVIKKMLDNPDKGTPLEVVSHGSYRRLKQPDAEKWLGKDAEVIADDFEAMSEIFKGDNTARVIQVAEAIDARMEDPEFCEDFLEELGSWVVSDESVHEKLAVHPILRDMIAETTEITYLGYEFGHGRYDSTWAKAQREDRILSFGVTYALADRMLHIISDDTGMYVPQSLHAQERKDLRLLNLEQMKETHISSTWMEAMNVQFSLPTEDEAFFEDSLTRLRKVMAEAGKTSEQIHKEIAARTGRFTSLSAIQLAGLEGHNHWVRSKLKAGQEPGATVVYVLRDYFPGEAAGIPVEKNKQGEKTVKEDPRLVHFVLLGPDQDIFNNTGAATLTGVYASRLIAAKNPVSYTYNDFLRELNAFVFDDTSLQSGEGRLMVRTTHAMWAACALWREGRKVCLENRQNQMILTGRLSQEELGYDIRNMRAALIPEIAAFVEQVQREQEKGLEVPPALDDVIHPFRDLMKPAIQAA